MIDLPDHLKDRLRAIGNYNATYKEGFVCGKFYPPHKGHQYLIETAFKHSRHVTVVVIQQPGQYPRGELRAGWIQNMFPRARVLLMNDLPFYDDDQVWAQEFVKAYYHQFGWDYEPDAVFTSENYGLNLSNAFECTCFDVDLDRTAYPISGSLVRSDWKKHKEFLPLIVRNWYFLEDAKKKGMYS